jgi:hypothetical protein
MVHCEMLQQDLDSTLHKCFNDTQLVHRFRSCIGLFLLNQLEIPLHVAPTVYQEKELEPSLLKDQNCGRSPPKKINSNPRPNWTSSTHLNCTGCSNGRTMPPAFEALHRESKLLRHPGLRSIRTGAHAVLVVVHGRLDNLSDGLAHRRPRAHTKPNQNPQREKNEHKLTES